MNSLVGERNRSEMS